MSAPLLRKGETPMGKTVRAPQTLARSALAREARWTARLTKHQRALLRLLAAEGRRMSRGEVYERFPENAPVERALTRLLQLGFAEWRPADQGSRNGVPRPAGFIITRDGQRRAARTRPPVTRTSGEHTP